MNLTPSVASSVFWGKVLRIADFMFGVAFSIIIVRRLGNENFGVYSNIDTIIGIGVFTAALGLAEAASFFLPHARVRISEKFARDVFLALNFLRFSIAGTFVVFFLFFGGWIAETLNVPAFKDFAPYIIILFIFRNIWEALDSHFNATLLWGRGLIAKSLAQITQFALVLPFLSWFHPVLAVVLAQTAGVVVSVVVYIWLARRFLLKPPDGGAVVVSKTPAPVPVGVAVNSRDGYELREEEIEPFLEKETEPTISRQEIRAMYTYSIIIWLISIFTFGLANSIDLVLVQYFLKDSYVTGMYRFAILTLVTPIHNIVMVWGRTFLPAIADIESRDGLEGMRRAVLVFNKINLLLVVPIMAGLIIVMPNLITTAFGKERLPAVPIAVTYAFFLLVFNLTGYGINLYSLYALKRHKIVLVERFCFGTINILMDLYMIPTFGAVGALVTTGICNLGVVIVEFWLLSRELDSRIPIRFLIKICLITGIATGGASIILFLNLEYGLLPLLGQMAIFGGLFFSGLKLIRLVEPEDRTAIVASLARKPQLARFANRVLAWF
jgi:O-antigen/teichoic acid export membrane protein